MNDKLKYFICGILFAGGSCNDPPKSPASRSRAPAQLQQPGASSNSSALLSAETMSQLAPCQAGAIPSIAYVKEKKAFYMCENGNWTEVDIKAPSAEAPQSGPGAPSQVQRWQDIWRNNVQKVGLVRTTYEHPSYPDCGIVGNGSGFIVANNLIATNGHVITPTTPVDPPNSNNPNTLKCAGLAARIELPLAKIEVWFPASLTGSIDTKTDPSVTITKVDRSIAVSDDLALLDAPGLTTMPVTLSAKDESKEDKDIEAVHVSDEVMILGYSNGLEFTQLAIGNINGFQPIEKILPNTPMQTLLASGRHVYIYDLVSSGGSSGSPIFDNKGEVIGINFAGNTEASGGLEYGYAVQVKQLRNLLLAPRQWVSPAGL